VYNQSVLTSVDAVMMLQLSANVTSVRVEYDDYKSFKQVAKKLSLMEDFKVSISQSIDLFSQLCNNNLKMNISKTIQTQ